MGRCKKNADKIIRHPLFLDKISKENAQIWDKKKALRNCIKKLRRIDDPDSKLHQAVLLNNTLQRIKSTDFSNNCQNTEQTLKENNVSKLQIKETYEDIFSEIHLPPPLNENQLDQLKIKSENIDPKRDIYYHSITNYHLEDGICLYDSMQNFNFDNFIIPENSLSLQRTQ